MIKLNKVAKIEEILVQLSEELNLNLIYFGK